MTPSCAWTAVASAVCEAVEVGLLPLPNVVLFPGIILPMRVVDPNHRALVRDAIGSGQTIAVPRLIPAQRQLGAQPAVFPTLGVAELIQHERKPDDSYWIVLRGVHRARLVKELRIDPYRVAEVTIVEESDPEEQGTVKALRATLVDQVTRLSRHAPKPMDGLIAALSEAALPGECADIAASQLVPDADAQQALLEGPAPSRRLEALINNVSRLLELLEQNAAPGSRSN